MAYYGMTDDITPEQKNRDRSIAAHEESHSINPKTLREIESLLTTLSLPESLPDNLTLREIRQFIALWLYGKESKEVLDIPSSSFSRTFTEMETKLNIGKLTTTANRESIPNPKGTLLAKAFFNLVDVYGRIRREEIPSLSPKILRIGAGGSLIGWLIGSRLNSVKDAVSLDEDKENPGKRIKIDAKPLSNREIVSQVSSGALDFGLVRRGVLGDSRMPIKSERIGIITYCLYIPREWTPDHLRHLNSSKALDFYEEAKILQSHPIATVGPDGEFRRQLDNALIDNNIDADIEFSYSAFPSVLPHMMRSSHITIMPNVAQLNGGDFFHYYKFPLGILQHYRREIFLIYSKDHETRTPWLNIQKLTDSLKFIRNIDGATTDGI